jgi:hypothetical protein
MVLAERSGIWPKDPLIKKGTLLISHDLVSIVHGGSDDYRKLFLGRGFLRALNYFGYFVPIPVVLTIGNHQKPYALLRERLFSVAMKILDRRPDSTLNCREINLGPIRDRGFFTFMEDTNIDPDKVVSFIEKLSLSHRRSPMIILNFSEGYFYGYRDYDDYSFLLSLISKISVRGIGCKVAIFISSRFAVEFLLDLQRSGVLPGEISQYFLEKA